MNYIKFVDVTNRDGVQTSRLGLAKLQKTIINLMLNEMGINQSEFGFPTTKHELNYLNGNLELVKRGAIKTTKLSGWMRGIEEDVLLSFQNVPRLKYINLSVSTSDQMIKGKFGGKKTRDDIIKSTIFFICSPKSYTLHDYVQKFFAKHLQFFSQLPYLFYL